MSNAWIVAAAAALGLTLAASDAKAWHFGEPHGGYHHGREETYVERRHRDRYVDEDDYEVRRHRHCREVEFLDHHGRHRTRTVCR